MGILSLDQTDSAIKFMLTSKGLRCIVKKCIDRFKHEKYSSEGRNLERRGRKTAIERLNVISYNRSMNAFQGEML